MFNGGANLVGLAGLVFAVLIIIFADSIILICGGDMADSFTRNNAGIYLCFCAPGVFFLALGMTTQELMNVLGFQTTRAVLGAVDTAVNLMVSIISVCLLPACRNDRNGL